MLNVEMPVGLKGRVAKLGTRESAIEPTPPSLASLARAALDEAEEDVKLATELLIEKLEDPAIRRAVSVDALRMASRSVISSTRTNERDRIERLERQRRDHGAAIRAEAATLNACLMDFPLPHGGTLRQADRPKIELAVSHYEKTAATSIRRAAWLKAVAAKLPEGKTVGDALTEADLQEAFTV